MDSNMQFGLLTFSVILE